MKKVKDKLQTPPTFLDLFLRNSKKNLRDLFWPISGIDLVTFLLTLVGVYFLYIGTFSRHTEEDTKCTMMKTIICAKAATCSREVLFYDNCFNGFDATPGCGENSNLSISLCLRDIVDTSCEDDPPASCLILN